MTFLAANLALLAVGFSVSARWFANERASLRVAITLGVALWGSTVITMAAGFLGLLGPWSLTFASVVLAALVVRPAVGSTPKFSPSPDAFEVSGRVAFGGVAGLWVAALVVSGTDVCFDDATYHASLPVTWWQQGGISYSPLTYQTYYPFHAEMPSLWMLTVSGNLGQSGLAVGAAAALLVASLLHLADGRASIWALLAAIGVSHRVVFFAHTFSANDLVLCAWLAFALALFTAESSLLAAVLVGVALGTSVGTKISAAPVALVLGVAYAWRWRRADHLLGACLGVVASGGWVWYARNGWFTSNPFYPAAVGPFDGPFDALTQRATSLVPFIMDKMGSIPFWMELVRERLDWPLPIGVLAMAGIGLGLAAFKRRPVWALMAVCALVFIVLHPFQPFSGTVNRPGAPLHAMVRYLTLPIVFGGFLLAVLPKRSRWTSVAWLGAWGWALIVGLPRLSSIELSGLAMGSAAMFGWTAWGRGRIERDVGVSLMVALVLSWVLGPSKQQRTGDGMRSIAKRYLSHEPVWSSLDTLPDGTAVAFLSHLPPTHTLTLPNLGSRQQHRRVPVARDGNLRLPMHESPPEQWWEAFDAPTLNQLEVASNLLANRVDVLVLSRCQQAEKRGWPAPRAALMRNVPERRLFSDTCAETWDLRGLSGLSIDPFARREAREGPPDIVLVSIDSLRADHLKSYGYRRKTAPFLDDLARRGVRFAHARSPSSWTLPSHTTLLTGVPSVEHGVVEDDTRLSPEAHVLPEILQKAGYRTFGAVGTTFVSSVYGFERGFTAFEDFGLHAPNAAKQRRVSADEARSFLFQQVAAVPLEQPVMMFLHTYDAHYPYAPPLPFSRRFDRATQPGLPYRSYAFHKKNPVSAAEMQHQIDQYDEAILWVDETLGRMDAELRALGRNPVWVVTSDHGEEFGERGSWGHGHTLYAEQLRVPLLVSGPGLPKGVVVDGVVGLQDVAPTLAALAKTALPGAQGLDLLPYLSGEQSVPSRALLSETSRHRTARLGLYEKGERLEWDLVTGSAERFVDDAERVSAGDPSELKTRASDLLGTPITFASGGLATSSGRWLKNNVLYQQVRVQPGQSFMVFPSDSTILLNQQTFRGLAPLPVGMEWNGFPRPTSVSLSDETRSALEALGYVQ